VVERNPFSNCKVIASPPYARLHRTVTEVDLPRKTLQLIAPSRQDYLLSGKLNQVNI
jgi:hypothetical protein